MDEITTMLAQVINELKSKMGDQYEIEATAKDTNNGGSLTGVSIRSVGTMIGKVSYLDQYLDGYKNGTLRISDIVEDIFQVMSKNGVPDADSLQEILNNYSFVKERVRIKLINYEANQEKLYEMPHKKYLDLAVVFYIAMGEVSNGIMTVQISNTLLENWEVSESDLYQQALSNTYLYEPVCISNLDFIMNQLTEDLPEELRDIVLEMMKGTKPNLYMATNPSHSYGASALLNPSALERFADAQDSDLIIYPASIDEILLQPVTEIDEEMTVNVTEVNEESVEKEKQLSNSIYLFERAKHAVRIFQKGGSLEK